MLLPRSILRPVHCIKAERVPQNFPVVFRPFATCSSVREANAQILAPDETNIRLSYPS
jgi:hypothetical protein